MNLTSPSQVKAWCIENEFHPNKVLGQNFLIDNNALQAIVDAGLSAPAAEASDSDAKTPLRVLEIGPGLGVLTEELLRRGCEVTAIEKDPTLAARLKEALGNPPGLTVVAGDALAWIDRLEQQTEVPHFDRMVSNLPYQAGTRILLDLARRREIPAMTVLVQTEVAERLAAGPGTKTRGLAGVWTQLDYDVQIVRKVSASCFWPRPEIGSSVVRLVRHDRYVSLTGDERDFFFRLTKEAFAHRRKQLGSIFKDMIQSTARAEELEIDDWTTLVKGLLHEDT